MALVGFPSVGKSTLLNKITASESATGAYEVSDYFSACILSLLMFVICLFAFLFSLHVVLFPAALPHVSTTSLDIHLWSFASRVFLIPQVCQNMFGSVVVYRRCVVLCCVVLCCVYAGVLTCEHVFLCEHACFHTFICECLRVHLCVDVWTCCFSNVPFALSCACFHGIVHHPHGSGWSIGAQWSENPDSGSSWNYRRCFRRKGAWTSSDLSSSHF